MFAREYVKFETTKRDLEQIIKDKNNDSEMIEMAEKDLNDLKKLIENQISSQYVQALNSITKKQILEGLPRRALPTRCCSHSPCCHAAPTDLT